MSAPLFHERQRWALCGVHAVNNLLQEHRFDKADFDSICSQLAPDSWINPHKSLLGVGNYDVNVLMVLLEQKLGYQVQWHDNRNELKLEDYGKDALTWGIVVNLPSTSLWARYVTKGRHWLTLLWQDDQQQWVNLDSDLKEPQVIGDMDTCTYLLNEWRWEKECHILLVKKGKETDSKVES